MNKLIHAIRFATKEHSGQTRKGKPDIPYITHPLAVGTLLAHVGAKENVIIAGILHDTIEDTDATKDEIEKLFGKTVAEIVDGVTEQDKSLPWAERKRIALEHIPHMDHDTLLVKTADALHNMTDSLEDYKIEGEDLFKHFNAPKESQLTRYGKLVEALEKTWKENPLLPQLKQTFSELATHWNQ